MKANKILSYAAPPAKKNIARLLIPWLGFSGAIAALAVTEAIWITGPLGNAHRDDIAMIGVLILGACTALAGCVGCFYRINTSNSAITALLMVLNTVATIFLLFGALNIYGRMY